MVAPAATISSVISSHPLHEQFMSQTPKPDLSDHEEETAPFDDVLRKLLAAKPVHRPAPDNQAPDEPPKAE